MRWGYALLALPAIGFATFITTWSFRESVAKGFFMIAALAAFTLYVWAVNWWTEKYGPAFYE